MNTGKLPKELDDMNNPSGIVMDEWGPGFHNITVKPARTPEEREEANEPPQELDDMNAPSPSTDYVIGIDFAVPDAVERMIGSDKPRSLWQRFLARIGLK